MNQAHGSLSQIHTKTRNGGDGYTACGMANPTSRDVLEASKARLTALFTELTRGCSRQRVFDGVKDIIRDTPTGYLEWSYRMLVRLAFQTRDSRGGKGEKDLSRWILLALYEFIPNVINAILPLLPEYGYWKDVPLLIADIIDNNHKRSKAPILDILYQMMVDAILKDHRAHLSWKEQGSAPKNKPEISLVAKFIPKENRAYDRKYKITKELAKRMFPSMWAKDFRSALRQYRKTVSRLNRFIDTTEVKMSGQNFSTINFNRVPSKCMTNYRKAFLNQKRGPNHTILERHPNDADRIKCSENLKSHMDEVKNGSKKTKIHGGQLTPYDIVHSLLESSSNWQASLRTMSSEELELIDHQFNDMRSQMIDTIPSSEEGHPLDCSKKGAMSKLGRTIPMIDVSGSMMGEPLSNGYYQAIPFKVAVGLGITLATLGQPPFSHRFLTFHENPSWVELRPEWPIHRMVETVIQAPWGGSTDLLAAFQLILNHAREHHLEKSDLPDRLVIFSDMDFDAAHRSVNQYNFSGVSQTNNWASTYDHIKSMWSGAGFGSPPEIVFWNLNAKKVAFPCRANTPGVRMISGWSPALFKLFVDDELDNYLEPTPWQTTEKAILDDRYTVIDDIVCNVLQSKKSDEVIQPKKPPDAPKPKKAKKAKKTKKTKKDEKATKSDFPEGWVEVDYSTDPSVIKLVKKTDGSKLTTKPATNPATKPTTKPAQVSSVSDDKEELRQQLLELQKQQMALMDAQQKLMSKLG